MSNIQNRLEGLIQNPDNIIQDENPIWDARAALNCFTDLVHYMLKNYQPEQWDASTRELLTEACERLGLPKPEDV